MTLSVALVGLGEISRYFAAACRRDAGISLVGVCDPDPHRLLPYERAGLMVAESIDTLLARGAPDAVIVTAPNDVHREVCTIALSSGLHVCCEKPLAPSLADAKAIQDVARAHNSVLFTAFHRNFNEHFLALTWLPVDQMRHVRVRYFEDIREHAGGESWYLDYERCGGGCLADNGPNAFAMLRELIGPLAVRRVQTTAEQPGSDIQAMIELTSVEGVRATVELDWRYPHGELKDLLVEMQDGAVHGADLLQSYQVFKSSLCHEYVGIVDAFRRAIAGEGASGRWGVEIAGLIEEAYSIADDRALST